MHLHRLTGIQTNIRRCLRRWRMAASRICVHAASVTCRTDWVIRNRPVSRACPPTTYVGLGNMRFETTDGKKEPIGQRIIELPEDAEKAELRDGHSGFVAYVPKGSIAKGEALALTGGDHVENGKIVKGKTVACAVCHGPQLKGLGNVPGLAGRSPIYLIRQLYDFKHGARTGKEVALMIPVVVGLTQDDML